MTTRSNALQPRRTRIVTSKPKYKKIGVGLLALVVPKGFTGWKLIEDDEYIRLQDGKSTKLIVFTIPHPESGKRSATYSLYYGSRHLGVHSTLAEATRKGDAYLKRFKRIQTYRS